MDFVWLFLGVGVFFSIVTVIWMYFCTTEQDFKIPCWCRAVEWFGPNRDDIVDRFEAIKWYVKMILQHMIVCFCMATAVSILAVLWMSLLYTLGGPLNSWFAVLFCLIIPLIFLYVGVHLLFKLSNFPKVHSHIIFIVTYIVSIFYWSNFIG